MPVIYDSRSPRGRPETWPSKGGELWGVRSPLPPQMEGYTWSKTTRAWLRAKNYDTNRPKAAATWRQNHPPEILICVGCGGPFLARQRTLARYCGATCRKRASRARTAA